MVSANKNKTLLTFCIITTFFSALPAGKQLAKVSVKREARIARYNCRRIDFDCISNLNLVTSNVEKLSRGTALKVHALRQKFAPTSGSIEEMLLTVANISKKKKYLVARLRAVLARAIQEIKQTTCLESLRVRPPERDILATIFDRSEQLTSSTLELWQQAALNLAQQLDKNGIFHTFLCENNQEFLFTNKDSFMQLGDFLITCYQLYGTSLDTNILNKFAFAYKTSVQEISALLEAESQAEQQAATQTTARLTETTTVAAELENGVFASQLQRGVRSTTPTPPTAEAMAQTAQSQTTTTPPRTTDSLESYETYVAQTKTTVRDDADDEVAALCTGMSSLLTGRSGHYFEEDLEQVKTEITRGRIKFDPTNPVHRRTTTPSTTSRTNSTTSTDIQNENRPPSRLAQRRGFKKITSIKVINTYINQMGAVKPLGVRNR